MKLDTPTGLRGHEHFPVDQLVERLNDQRARIDLSGGELYILPFLVSQLRKKLERHVLVVVPENSDAVRMRGDLSFYASNRERIGFIPTVDASPYGHLSPDRNSVVTLLGELACLAWDQPGSVTVCAAAALARRVMPRDVLIDQTYLVSTGDEFDRSACLRYLADGGYRSVGTVEDPGTFAVRGGIIDVFPPQNRRPLRIELWGDEVESIQFFEPTTQRTLGHNIDSAFLAPVREELLVDPYVSRARKSIREAAADVGQPTRQLQPLLDDLNNAIPFMGIEAYRPGFFDSMDSVFDYLPADTVVITYDPMGVNERFRSLWDDYERARSRALEDGTASLEVQAHLISPNALKSQVDRYAHVRAHVIQMVDELGAIEGPDDAIKLRIPDNTQLRAALEQSRGEQFPLQPLAKWARGQIADGVNVLITARQETQLDRVERVLKNFGLSVERTSPDGNPLKRISSDACATLMLGELTEGFSLQSHGFSLVTEQEIFGKKMPKRRRNTVDATSPFVQDFRQLKPGDTIVHVDHGLGEYQGLKKLAMGGHEHDFLVLAFAGTDKLYVPVYKLGRLQKYSGSAKTSPRLDKLGGTAWQKVRARAKKSAEEDALALLDLYAKRELAQGYQFSEPDDFYRSFEGTFPFEETPDQGRSIDEVIADMTRSRPMDRLLCGDVGFGKTEVALRAAMKAVLDGKQVCVLVPTTVLALQHYKTFTERFKQYPVQTALFSRLVNRSTVKENLFQLSQGQIDIAIGTHRLLGKDIEFSDLGLLILDEEHRFGVKHKERIKEFRTNVDVLAMTATPIPRTLQLSLSGIRDLSVITTPPVERLSVRTYVCRATDAVVGEAIARELGRGGQVFFVHNRVHSIESRAAWIQSLAPHARVVIGHGQMEPQKLERVMVDFTEGRHNVLVATTIIESGIDIPTANTMIIDQADRFGLAQLYQLRGRVGRSRERGYCYCLIPGEAALDKDARARLAVIQKFTELGSGFHVASHDLELRGAGELLGTKQKGHVQAVGIDLYAQLLDDAVRSLRGQAPRVDIDPDLNLRINARIPDEYVPDNQLRLMLYKRLANAKDEEHVLTIADEMSDRFGDLPPPLTNLIEVMRIRTLAKALLIETIDHTAQQLSMTFHSETPLAIRTIIALVRRPKSQFRVPADFRLAYAFDAEERKDTVRAIRTCLQSLAEMVEKRDEDADIDT